jgi:hypothetical protein
MDGGLSFPPIPGAAQFNLGTAQILIDPHSFNNVLLTGIFYFSDDPLVARYIVRSTDGGVTFRPVQGAGLLFDGPGSMVMDLGQAIIDRVLERGRLIRLDGPSVRTLHLKLDEALKDDSDQDEEVARISGNK